MRDFKANAYFISIFKVVTAFSYYYEAGSVKGVIGNIFCKHLKPVELCICLTCNGGLVYLAVIFYL